MKNLLILLLLCSVTTISLAQNTRIKDNNSIGWYALNGVVKLNDRWSVNGEFQWRRVKVISDPQQTVYKAGINYKVSPGLSLRAGVALAETYNYGDYPLNNLGKQFTEHRTFQAATLSNKLGLADVSHRFMLEQRWVGRYTNAALSSEDDYVYTNRMRYMFRLQIPLKGREITDKTPYVAVYDEAFIGFGKNVNENVFDQNRIGVLLGYRFSPKVRIEGGYLSQIAQLGREIGGRNVLQFNNGIILSTNLSF